MHRFKTAIASLGAICLLTAGTAIAEDLVPDQLGPVSAEGQTSDPWSFFDGWMMDGSNTIRFDQYGQKGADGPYFDEGAQYYDEINLNLRKQDGIYRQWRGQIALLLGDNGYRSIDRGVVPERINLTRVVGDRKIGDRVMPYRWELGDYFAFTSYMTQQLSGKGLQMEMQPGFFGNSDSIVFFGGTNEDRWQELTFDEDASIGGSYLHRFDSYGEVSANAIYNFREGALAGAPDLNQGVVSATYAHDFVVRGHTMTVQAEQAFLGGDHTGAMNSSNRFGVGTFAELRGQHPTLPLDYRIRGERYDEDFQPRGAVVTSDRQSGELHLGWRFDSGLRLRGRFQGFEDSFQQANELQTTLGGLNLSGPLFQGPVSQVNGNADFLARQVRDDDRTFNTNTYSFTTNLGTALCEKWYGRFDFFAEIADDRTAANADLDTWQLTFSADYEVAIGGLRGLVTPGLITRFLRTPSGSAVSDSDEFQPTLALRLGGDGHSIGFNYGSFAQLRSGPMSTDLDRHTLSGDYRFQAGRGTVGAEFNYFGFRKDPGDDTDAWRVGLFWTFNFDHDFDRSGVFPSRPEPAVVPSPYGAESQGVNLASLAPGMSYNTARDSLAADGVTGRSRYGDYEVYDYQVLPRIDQRQRLVLIRSGKTISASAIVITFDSTFTGDSIAQTFERTRKALIDLYGNPSQVREQGEFSDRFVADVNSEALIRVTEWETPSGVIRFGIPRRLDGEVRMEVQHRSHFASPRDTLWSIEGVR